ncbi:MAG: sodium-dependent transporter [Betaproteobacteria bacterium]|nr:MAG: sodium-dependent transporter [Betaproteobacteria bacterium]
MREQWGTRAGFVLATIGCAAGLGNIWRFSYVAGENGGAAFLLIYVLCVTILGVPLMLGEFSVGRRAQADAVASFESGTSRPSWATAGWLMAAVSFVFLSYYAVIAGWAYKYFVDYLTGATSEMESGTFTDYFGAFVADPLEPVFWQFIVVTLTVTVVAAGIKRGIESVNKILMPLLGLLVIILAAYALSLDGARAGLAFLFRPDWEALSQPGVYLAALGQAFFSLGIGAGALLTYGSYTTSDQKLAPAALTVATGDTLFAIVAGVAIFPAVFAFGLDPAQGPTLAFVTLPEVFNVLPAGRLFAIAFFVLLGLAALTSSVSMLEVPCAVLMRRLQWSRRRTAIVIGVAAFLAGVPSALGFGVWREIGLSGMGILQTIDMIASSILLPIGGLLIALFVGWTWSGADALRVAGMADGHVGRAWLFLLRFIAPCLIVLILLALLLG